MVNTRNFLLLLAGLGLLPALGLIFLTLFLVYVPAWQIFLGWSSPILVAGLLLILFPILGMMNLPLPLRLENNLVGINILSLLTPMVLLPVTAFRISPAWSWLVLAPICLSVILYHSTCFITVRGVKVFGWTVTLANIFNIYILHILFGSRVEHVMWWAFAIQFFTVLGVETYKTVHGSEQIYAYRQFLVIGGKGVKNVLWSAPTSAIAFVYLGYWALWGLPASMMLR
jgi:hypothetical protein